MDHDILKMLPQKAFQLIAFKETLRLGALLTRSTLDVSSYKTHLIERRKVWSSSEVEIVEVLPEGKRKTLSGEDAQRVLQIYFAQFYSYSQAIHLDLRKKHFALGDSLFWTPSRLHYSFSEKFTAGVRSLYEGFYLEDDSRFEKGMLLLGLLPEDCEEKKKQEIKKLFYAHFGEGRHLPVRFSLKKLQDSFNTIFSYFIKNDIPLNPEFALLGAMLVTLYLTLEECQEEINVRDSFLKVIALYTKKEESI